MPATLDTQKQVDTSAGAPKNQLKGKSTTWVSLPARLLGLFLLSEMFDYHALKLVTVTPDKLIFLALISFLVYEAVTKRLKPLRWSKLDICMLLFAVLCIASYVISAPDAGQERYKWLTTLFNLLAYPFVVYLVAKRTVYRGSNTIRLLRIILLIGAYLALTAVCEHYRVSAFVFPKYILDPTVGIQFGRARGPMVGSNPMGEWLVLAYLATCLVMPFSGALSKTLMQGLILLIAVGVYFTLTRGVWVSFAIAVLMGSLLGASRLRLQARLLVLAVIVAFFAGVGSKFSFSGETLFSRRQNTIDYRMSNNKTTFAMGMAHPIFGIGYGNFSKYWRAYFGSEEKELTKDLTDGNHNTYLGLFADLGLPGVALYIALLACMLWQCFKARTSLPSSCELERNLAISGASLVMILMWEGVSGDMRFNPTLNTMTFLFVGIVASLREHGTKYLSKRVEAKTRRMESGSQRGENNGRRNV